MNNNEVFINSIGKGATLCAGSCGLNGVVDGLVIAGGNGTAGGRASYHCPIDENGCGSLHQCQLRDVLYITVIHKTGETLFVPCGISRSQDSMETRA